jgi:ABC-type multidrug transport system ATPase subunit
VAVIGESQEGKSSLLKIIFGTSKADHQEIYFDGKKRSKVYLKDRLIHFCPVNYFIPGYLRLEGIAKMFEWKPEDHSLLLELAPIRKTRLNQLSTSQRKLVEIAAVLNAPGDYVLLDEPLTLLEKTEENLFVKLLKRIKKRKGIILTFRPQQQLPDFVDKLYELTRGHLIKIEDWGRGNQPEIG